MMEFETQCKGRACKARRYEDDGTIKVGLDVFGHYRWLPISDSVPLMQVVTDAINAASKIAGNEAREQYDATLANATNKLHSIRAIIEAVDDRAEACDGPVRPTLAVMTSKEIVDIYRLAGGEPEDDGMPAEDLVQISEAGKRGAEAGAALRKHINSVGGVKPNSDSQWGSIAKDPAASGVVRIDGDPPSANESRCVHDVPFWNECRQCVADNKTTATADLVRSAVRGLRGVSVDGAESFCTAMDAEQRAALLEFLDRMTSSV